MTPSSDTALDRSQFPVSERYVYLNHAGVAPLPACAAEAGKAFLDDFVQRGAVRFTVWEDGIENVREDAARIMGVDATEVAFVKNTTEGLAFVANGLRWEPGERVIVADREFPSTVYPFLSLRELGVEVEIIEPTGDAWSLPLERFEAALRAAPTRLVAVSWVQFARGWRMDLAALAALCHEHGALLCVDAIQGLGALPAAFNEWGVDFAAADAHKWLLGPLGTGVFFVADRHRELLRPLEPGWASVRHREQWDNLQLIYDDSARRFEGGSQTLETITQMGAAMALLLGAGVDRVWAHIEGLTAHVADGLEDAGATVVSTRDPEHRSGIVTFTIPGRDAGEVQQLLDGQRFVCAARGGGIRIAPHGYNTNDEMDRLVGAVRSIITGR